MIRHYRWIFCCGSLLFSARVLAGGNLAMQERFTPSYGPVFLPGTVQPVKTKPCKLMGSGLVLDVDEPQIARCSQHEISVKGIATSPKHREDEPHANHVQISIKGSGIPIAQANIRMADFPADFVDGVDSADLNGDGKPDFILDLSFHGNGLAGEIGGKLFILSSKRGYTYASVQNVMRDSSLVRLAGRTSATLVLQRLVTSRNNSHSIRSNDKRSHTLFMFDLVDFDATAAKGLKLVNSVDKRFPFFTLFTDKPNHEETTLLGQSTKQKLWRDPIANTATGKLATH